MCRFDECIIAAVAIISLGTGAFAGSDDSPTITSTDGGIVVKTLEDGAFSYQIGDAEPVAVNRLPSELKTYSDSNLEAFGLGLGLGNEGKIDACDSNTAIIDAIVAATNAGQRQRAAEWVATSPPAGLVMESGTIMQIYGRGFISQPEAYTVTTQLLDSDGNLSASAKPLSQQVTSVTPEQITINAVYPGTESAKAFKTNFVVTEGTNVLSGPAMVMSWQPVGPQIAIVDESKPLVLTRKLFSIDLFIADGDHEFEDLDITAKSSNTDMVPDSSFKLVAEESSDKSVFTIDVKDKSKLKTDTDFSVTITVKDPAGQTAELVLAMKIEIPTVEIDGWTLIMKIRGSDGSDSRNRNGCEKYKYDWSGWESSSTDGNKNDATLNPANVKYGEFLKVKFKTIRVCSGSGSGVQNPKTGGRKCYEHTFEKQWDSAKELFEQCDRGRNYISNGRKCRTSNRIRNMYNIFQFPRQPRNCNAQLPGFSQRGNDNARARWGYMNNINQQGCQPADSQDSDGAMGIGINAQNGQCACGAGQTPWFSHYPQYGCRYCRNAWIWVKA